MHRIFQQKRDKPQIRFIAVAVDNAETELQVLRTERSPLVYLAEELPVHEP
jgi:hypothetical protein